MIGKVIRVGSSGGYYVQGMVFEEEGDYIYVAVLKTNCRCGTGVEKKYKLDEGLKRIMVIVR